MRETLRGRGEGRKKFLVSGKKIKGSQTREKDRIKIPSRDQFLIARRRKNFLDRKNVQRTQTSEPFNCHRDHPSPTLVNETRSTVLRHRVFQPTFFSVQFSPYPTRLSRVASRRYPRKPAGNGSSKIFIALPEPLFAPSLAIPSFSTFFLLPPPS